MRIVIIAYDTSEAKADFSYAVLYSSKFNCHNIELKKCIIFEVFKLIFCYICIVFFVLLSTIICKLPVLNSIIKNVSANHRKSNVLRLRNQFPQERY